MTTWTARLRGLREGIVPVVLIVALAVFTGFLCVVAYQHAHPSVAGEPSTRSGDGATGSALHDVGQSRLAEQGPYSTLWLGGSLTTSAGASDNAHGYRPVIVAALAQRGRVSQKIVTGSLDDDAGLLAAATGGPPRDLVVVEVGPDVAAGVKTGAARRRLAQVLGAARDTSPDAVLVCLGPWQDAADAATLEATVQKVCRGVRGTYVALSDLYDDDGSRGPAGRRAFSGDGATPRSRADATEPNDTGYAEVADRVLAALDVSDLVAS